MEFEIAHLKNFGNGRTKKLERNCDFCSKAILRGKNGRFCSSLCHRKFWSKERASMRRSQDGKFYLMKARFKAVIKSMNQEQLKTKLDNLIQEKIFVEFKIAKLKELTASQTEAIISEVEK